jgi:hypothetical protein
LSAAIRICPLAVTRKSLVPTHRVTERLTTWCAIGDLDVADDLGVSVPGT